MFMAAEVVNQVSPVRNLLKWVALALPVGLAAGCACAVFLTSLEWATQFRVAHPQLLYLLPLAGLCVGWIYQRFGQSVEAGNNLIVDEIHQPRAGIPLRMAPLVLLGTILTHLCGGSAGREGTAVQMGGSLASTLARWVPGLTSHDIRIMLTAGIAAGFGGVFGTPLAGTVFAMEVLAIGRISYHALVPCLAAAIISDQTCQAWGVGHTNYHVARSSVSPAEGPLAVVDLQLALLAALIGVLSGGVSWLFAELLHGAHRVWKSTIRNPLWRPFCGGLAIIALTFALGTDDYLGLGVTAPDNESVSITSCFHAGGAGLLSWWWKLLFTVVTLSSGFKGGEVTPLFFIGAALGHAIGTLTGAPIDLLAAMGFVAVFAGATNTPLACTLMGIELFGSEFSLYYGIACVVAYQCSGHSGIYLSQRIGIPKTAIAEWDDATSLREIRSRRTRTET